MNEQNNNDPKLTEAMQAAYPSQQPSEQLAGRMVDAERTERLRGHRPQSGWKKGWLVLFASLAVLSVLGFTVYKIFFDRTGEAAIAMIPADADMVVTIDTSPSARQLPTFQKIAAALNKEGIMEELDGFLTMTLDQNPVAKEIRPYVAKSLALAVWMPDGGFEQPGSGGPNAAAFFALTNRGAVESSLNKYLQPQNNHGFPVYALDKHGFAAIIGNYLIFAPTPDVLVKVNDVSRGSRQSLAQLNEYRAARSSLADDSNLMFFLSPRALATIDQASKGGTGVSPFNGAEWLAVGMALREDGLEFTYHCPMDSNKVQALRHLAEIKPLDPALLQRIPEGAYGVLAYSQVGKYWDVISDAASHDPGGKAEMDKGLAEFEKATGLNIPRDIVPAFNGTMVLAVYPARSGDTESVDGMLILDDSNGANPAAVAEKIRALIERESAKKGEHVTFVKTEMNGATVWKLDASSQKAMVQGMSSNHQSFTGAPDEIGAKNPIDPVFPENMDKMSEKEMQEAITKAFEDAEKKRQAEEAKPQEPQKPVEINPAVKDKTIIYAQVGNGIILASSEAMLSKALDAYRGKGTSLAGDPAFTTMQSKVKDNAQAFVMISLHRIMEVLRPNLEKEETPISVDDIVNLFGGPGTGLVGSSWYDGKIMVGEMFMPLDYERLVGLMGKGMKMGKESTHTIKASEVPALGMRTARVATHVASLH